jgi:hypothetical protein
LEPGFSSLADLLRHPDRYQTPVAVEDSFRPYLENLYREIVHYLDRAVIFSLKETAETPIVPLSAATRADAVAPSGRDTIFRAFFDQLDALKDDAANVYDSVEAAFSRYGGRLLLMGDPGAGKTVALMAFARDAVARRLADPNAAVPFLAPVSQWNSNGKPALADWLVTLNPGLGKSIGQRLGAGSGLLLLDGLDELGEERLRADGITEDPKEAFLAILPPQNQILLTCRTKNYEKIRTKAALGGAVDCARSMTGR